MREQLMQYVNLLFAGTDDTEELKEEILQNTLDRYDDLIDQGKTPEDAYRLSISSIGDLDVLLGRRQEAGPDYVSTYDLPGIPVGRIIRAFAVGLYIFCLAPIILMDMIGLSEVGLFGTLVIIAAATLLIILFPKKKDATQPAIPMPDDAMIRLVRGLAIFLYITSIAPIILFDKLRLENVGVCCTLAIIAIATVLIMIYRKPKQAAPVQPVSAPAQQNDEVKKSVGKLVDKIGLVAYFLISFATGAWHITWVIFLLIPSVRGLIMAILDLKKEG